MSSALCVIKSGYASPGRRGERLYQFAPTIVDLGYIRRSACGSGYINVRARLQAPFIIEDLTGQSKSAVSAKSCSLRRFCLGVGIYGGMIGGTHCATLHMTGIWPTKIAQAMSVMSFALPFGGTVALAIMGAVFNNKLARSQSSTGKINPHDYSSLQSISALLLEYIR